MAGLAATAAVLVLIAVMTSRVRRGWLDEESRAATAVLLVVAVPSMVAMAVIAGTLGAWSGVAVAAAALLGLGVSVLPVADEERPAPAVVALERHVEPGPQAEERRAA